MNSTRSNSLKLRRTTVLGVLIALILVAAIGALYFVSAAATPPSAVEARVQGWVNELSDAKLTPERHEAQQNLEAAGEAAVDPLMTALHSPNAALRRNSAEMLGFIASPRAGDALSNVLKNDVDPAVRNRAAWALGELHAAAYVRNLEQSAILDRNHLVRQAAAGSLTAIRVHLAEAAGKDERLVSAFAVAPNQTNIVYIAELRQLSVSRDGGKTWALLPGTIPSRVSALTVSPVNPNTIYAGTEAMGVFKSTDGGTTWVATNQGLGVEPGVRMSITAISIDPNNVDRVYVARGAWVGTSNATLLPMGLMLSIDGGASWQSLNMPNTQDAISRLLLSGDKLYVLVGDRVLSFNI